MNKFEYKNLTPFKWFVLENFPFIEADFDALTEWQLFCKLGKEINKIIDSQNIVGEQAETLTNAFNTLKNYVDNYFNNLDVQDEINNKLNEMAQDGTLQEIITSYLNVNGILAFNTVNDMKNATVEQALAHPRWNMGKKITVDSATLMNKGLEVIEAHHLFNMDYDRINVVVHPQSIVHSAIEYVDGSVIAQLGLPSMHIPIQYAITYPERFEGIKSKSFSFAEIARLDFEEPNWDKFKALNLAYDAGRLGGSATVCLNAANEEAVFEFLEGKIKLFDIIHAVEEMMQNHNIIKKPSVDEIFDIDSEIRIKTKEWLKCSMV